METNFGGQVSNLFGMSSASLMGMGKRTMDWKLSDWKWDGDLFIASPVNALPPSDNRGREFFPLGSGVRGGSSNSSSSCSDEANTGMGDNRNRESEKRRRAALVAEGQRLNEEDGNLSLKLGGAGGSNGHSLADGEASGKKTKVVGPSSNRSVCQVVDCGADLSNAKDYHRRHKVCEVHSKANSALVGNVMQRFCQQCSRFQALPEFDEGKRSCRRRLAGHNRRRRKTNPESVANGSSTNDEQTNGYLLLTLLKILSNMHSSRSDQTNDQDLLAHLLKSLGSNNVANGVGNISGLLQGSQSVLNSGTSSGREGLARPDQHLTRLASAMPQKESLISNATPDPGIVFPIKDSPPTHSDRQNSSPGRTRSNNFDLNDVYVDSDDSTGDPGTQTICENLGTGSRECPLWLQHESHQSSPPQTSRNSDSVSAQSPSSSSGDAQSRTDRIVFKLFGKEPNEFPLVLRSQILDWLSHSPTDIESYIRPGCIVLTIYLHMEESVWEELCSDLSSSLDKLLQVSEDPFFRTGWLYIRVQDQIALIYNGQIVVDSSLPFTSPNSCKILSVRPIAIPISRSCHFSVRGFNLTQPTTRLRCAIDGKYLVQEDPCASTEAVDCSIQKNELECVKFSCSEPTEAGRGFFEVDDDGLGSSFFPFIVAEYDICSEICMLESEIESSETGDKEMEELDIRTKALDFVHEMGWLLHRTQLKIKLGGSHPNTDLFSLERFMWLMDFSIERDWCAVVKKLLDILFNGIVGLGEHPSLDVAVSEMGLLHRAVRKNSRLLVELLLRYVPEIFSDDTSHRSFFTPDADGPGSLTPLHIAAGRDGSEDMLDALTDDPGMVGIEAWKSARDTTGSSPEDYARLRGHYSYIHLVQRKISSRRPVAGHVVLDIPCVKTDKNVDQKQKKLTSGFNMESNKLQSCKACDYRGAYGHARRSFVYRPAMLSMVAIAAVCVCVALLFKSSPDVLHGRRPFRWENLHYGSI